MVSPGRGGSGHGKDGGGSHSDDVLAADALILGSPVHMGCMDWRVKRFIDQVCSQLWMGNKIVGKVGAVFVTGGGYGNGGGGCELAMLGMMNNLLERMV